ncbi:MAG: ABC transporter permease [Alphaproteobacteria bacterium PA4]|nr:MAG: ABC transporter permease [Alphaproteobacteria bacterium PA4]
MTALAREWRLLAGPSRLGLVVLALLASMAVALGLADVAAIRADIARVVALETRETQAITAFAKGDPGEFGYYRNFPVWRMPGDLAFVAPTRGDAVPAVMRIRILALEGQINDNEAANPELLLAGRFDFAFVTVYLAPLLLIALLHDLWSGEREAGRLAALDSLPRARQRLWSPRVVLRAGGVVLALLVPLAIGALVEGTAPLRLGAAVGLVLLSLAFWMLVTLAVARLPAASATQAAVLAGLWFAITLVVPAAAHLGINAAVPLPDAAAIARENREDVHAGWDRPKAQTMARFVRQYPAYADQAATGVAFEWKWYFAFQQLGDDAVATDSAARDAGIARREGLAQTIGCLLPPIKAAQGLQALAGSDVEAELAFKAEVRAYHRALREYHYPYLFGGRTMSGADIANAPGFMTRPSVTSKADDLMQPDLHPSVQVSQ